MVEYKTMWNQLKGYAKFGDKELLHKMECIEEIFKEKEE